MNPDFVVFLWAEQDTYSVSVSLVLAVWIFFSYSMIYSDSSACQIRPSAKSCRPNAYGVFVNEGLKGS